MSATEDRSTVSQENPLAYRYHRTNLLAERYLLEAGETPEPHQFLALAQLALWYLENHPVQWDLLEAARCLERNPIRAAELLIDDYHELREAIRATETEEEAMQAVSQALDDLVPKLARAGSPEEAGRLLADNLACSIELRPSRS